MKRTHTYIPQTKDRTSPDLDLRFNASERETSPGQFRQMETFVQLLGLWIRTLHLDHMAGLAEDEQSVFTLRKIIKEIG